jgi:hypothetical protein
VYQVEQQPHQPQVRHWLQPHLLLLIRLCCGCAHQVRLLARLIRVSRQHCNTKCAGRSSSSSSSIQADV